MRIDSPVLSRVGYIVIVNEEYKVFFLFIIFELCWPVEGTRTFDAKVGFRYQFILVFYKIKCALKHITRSCQLYPISKM